MTDNSTTESVDITDDLNAFEAEFYQTKDTKPSEPVEEEEIVEDTEDDGLATEEDTDAADADEDDEDTGEAQADPEPEPKRKKPSAQERINELTKARREAERREQQLLQRLEALEAETRTKEKEAPVSTHIPQGDGAPSPDAVDANGELVYPLGTFDPKFIEDLTKFTINREKDAMKAELAQREAAQKLAAEQAALTSQWEDKLTKAEEHNPDIREDIASLVDTIQSMRIDPAYGDYLATTIMQCENGPEILEYLSDNIGEAQKIVASGPAAATLAIGRLEAKLALASDNSNEEKRNIPNRIPTAKAPPPAQTKGRQGRTNVRGDTDNLDDFEKVFFAKR